MDVESLDRNDPETNKDVTTLDLRGLKCPLPVLRTRKALEGAAAGARLEIWADDPLAPLDIAHLCRAEGHEAEAPEALRSGGWRFRIRKGAAGGEAQR